MRFESFTYQIVKYLVITYVKRINRFKMNNDYKENNILNNFHLFKRR